MKYRYYKCACLIDLGTKAAGLIAKLLLLATYLALPAHTWHSPARVLMNNYASVIKANQCDWITSFLTRLCHNRQNF